MNHTTEASLHFALLKATEELRQHFAAHNESYLTLNIEASGRPDGDMLLKYSIGKYCESVKGDTLHNVVNEYFRRQGWDERHAPFCLPNVEPVREPAPTPPDPGSAYEPHVLDGPKMDEAPLEPPTRGGFLADHFSDETQN